MLLFLVIVTGLTLSIALYFFLSVWIYSGKDKTRKADAAVVLGAAVYDDTPSPVFEQRIRHGITLYKQGWVKKLVFTGGRDNYDKKSESGAARTMAIKAGVPAKDILIEDESTTTWGNLYYAEPVLKKAGLKKVLIVSDPLHMKRAMSMAGYLDIKAFTSPTPTTMYQSGRSQLEFALHEAALYAGFLGNIVIGGEMQH